MKCFPLLPCYGGPVVATKWLDNGDLEITYQSEASSDCRVIAEEPEGSGPQIHDIVIIHGPTVSWMTPDEFAEHYEEISNVAAQ